MVASVPARNRVITPMNTKHQVATRLVRSKRAVIFHKDLRRLAPESDWLPSVLEGACRVPVRCRFTDIFADRRDQSSANDRIVMPEGMVAREPDLIIGSWCGKKFRPERVVARSGFDRIPAVRNQDLYEIKSPMILQPGPAALTDGLSELQRIIERWAIRC